VVGITVGSSTRKKRPVTRYDNNNDDDMMMMMMMMMMKGSPVPYFKYEPQSMLENSSYKLYYDMSIMTDQTIHYNRQDIVILDRPIKETYLIDVAIPNSHNLYRIITEKPQKYADLKEEVIRVW
jgi:hypothetical protein